MSAAAVPVKAAAPATAAAAASFLMEAYGLLCKTRDDKLIEM